jgi:hypothetical protein
MTCIEHYNFKVVKARLDAALRNPQLLPGAEKPEEQRTVLFVNADSVLQHSGEIFWNHFFLSIGWREEALYEGILQRRGSQLQ